jgi:hypothetical protein
MLTSIRAFFHHHGARIACVLRQQLRRWLWLLLFVAGALSYPLQLRWMVNFVTAGADRADLLAMRAAAYAKMVSPLYFFSKTSLSIGIFCLVNLLGWAALLVVPVLIDWATGYYKKQRADFPETRGFKGTFLLGLTDWQRMLVFVAVWALEIFTAVESAKAGFTIQ